MIRKNVAWTRREMLQSASIATLSASIPWSKMLQSSNGAGARGAHWASSTDVDPTILIDGWNVRALALRALDAAKSAGADYADVRLTRQLRYGVSNWDFKSINEQLGIGVRARVQGSWGFAGSPYWNMEEAVNLAHTACTQASANVRGSMHTEWVPTPVTTGSWTTPIKIDPFVLPMEEKMDRLQAWMDLAPRYRGCSAICSAQFFREERVIATTEGAYCTQTLYQSGGNYTFARSTTRGDQLTGNAQATGLATTAAGWEIFDEADILGQLPALYAAADPSISGPAIKPGNIGRYEVVFDAASMGSLLEQTIGTAAQVDRALGYEANASGTSYLGPDPLRLLGTYHVAAPIVTITANRSMPRGVGTVKWDDEGVEPDDFTLVRNGMLVDYQTTRGQAAILTPWYQKSGKPIRSHGCAAADTGLSISMQHIPNLVLEPGIHDIDFNDLIADIPHGLAVIGAQMRTDFQQRTGTGMGIIQEIVNGQLGKIVANLGITFNATQIWKNIVALGGSKSVLQYASTDLKGQPVQSVPYSLRVVPARIENVDFVDLKRKAS